VCHFGLGVPRGPARSAGFDPPPPVARAPAMASSLLVGGVDLRKHHEALETLTRRRLPLAMAVLLAFIGGALPIELYFYRDRLRPYVTMYALEIVVCAIAWVAARRCERQSRAIATAWGAVLGLCIAAYYPLVRGDANIAMAALICLVAAVPAILPFDVGHQLVMGGICALGFFGVLASGLPTSIPWPYGFMAFLSVLTTTALGARSVSRFRREAFERETTLRQAHDQLRTALGRARDAVEMRSRLVANVSHELRTPLNVIVGYADMLVDADDRATIVDTAPRIRDYAMSLEALVNDLLDLSRLTCRKVGLHVEDVAVAPVLEDVACGARAIADGKPIVVRVDCELARISTDGMRLRQILNNLATNAAKFTDVGTITIRAFRDRDAAVFEVRDTGRGIPAAQHEAIFAAFEQIAPGGHGKNGGIGLGLAIVHQLTELLGGSVAVASAPGAGATFTVRLPLVIAAHAVRDGNIGERLAAVDAIAAERAGDALSAD